MRPNDHLLDLLLEVQTLDRVPRSGYVLRGVPEPESVSEHSWHVVFLVWALGRRVATEQPLDVHRALEIALVHDLAEMRVGDLPRTANRYFPEGAKKAAETAAMEEILAPLPPESRELYAEYAAGASVEARLVKACDKLQLMVKVSVYERWGACGLEEFWNEPENFPDGGFAPVRELFDELRRRREAALGTAAPAEACPPELD
jgi:putative hydrolase of HD superfamily